MKGKSMSETWGTIIAALIVASATIYSVRFGVKIFMLEQEEKRKQEILQERKIALFNALNVIDLVYRNSNLNGKPPLSPKEWNLDLARQATNKMLIYCKNPRDTASTFYKAIGLYNPDTEKAPGIQIRYLDEFRKQVAWELELPSFDGIDLNKVWIASLPGTKEAYEAEQRNIRK